MKRQLYRLRLDWIDGHQTWTAWYNTRHEAQVALRGLSQVASIYNIHMECIG